MGLAGTGSKTLVASDIFVSLSSDPGRITTAH
jgi:hypothetical protein